MPKRKVRVGTAFDVEALRIVKLPRIPVGRANHGQYAFSARYHGTMDFDCLPCRSKYELERRPIPDHFLNRAREQFGLCRSRSSSTGFSVKVRMALFNRLVVVSCRATRSNSMNAGKIRNPSPSCSRPPSAGTRVVCVRPRSRTFTKLVYQDLFARDRSDETGVDKFKIVLDAHR
jgi:hypothetical protein